MVRVDTLATSTIISMMLTQLRFLRQITQQAKNLNWVSIIEIIVLVANVSTRTIQLIVKDWNIADAIRHLWNLHISVGINQEVQVTVLLCWSEIKTLEISVRIVIFVSPSSIVVFASPIVTNLVRIEATGA
jgi:hypothetical protein